MLVGISGYARAGKDTLGQILVERYGFERRAFADKLREAALVLDPIVTGLGSSSPKRLSQVVEAKGWEEAKKLEEVRRTLQRLGTEVGRNTVDPYIWVTALENTLERNITGEIKADKNYVITDCRYQNEAAWISTRHNGYMVRVNRPGVGPANGHSSEHDLDNWPFDIRVENDGTIEDLAKKLDYWAERYWGVKRVSS